MRLLCIGAQDGHVSVVLRVDVRGLAVLSALRNTRRRAERRKRFAAAVPELRRAHEAGARWVDVDAAMRIVRWIMAHDRSLHDALHESGSPGSRDVDIRRRASGARD